MRPNILLISLIPLRADHLACYGYTRQTAPHIDQLAQEGVLFERAVTTAPWTPPAHASLLTGLYPPQHGVVGDAGLRDDIPTLPGLLSEMGYRTAAFIGNPHVGRFKRLDRGFQDFFQRGQRLAADAPAPVATVRRQARALAPQALWRRWRLAQRRNKYKYAPRTTQSALAWLKAQAAGPAPFFALCEYSDLHHPYMAPSPYRYRYLSGWRPRFSPHLWRLNRNPFLYMTGVEPATAADLEALRALYDGAISYVDAHVGRLLAGLRQLGVLDRTVVILLSPHGENIGEHGLGAHQSALYETVLHIPLIVRYPPAAPAGLRLTSLVQSVDILPTLLELAGRPTHDLPIAGRTLLPLTAGRVYRETAYAQWEGVIPDQLRLLTEAPAQAFRRARFTRTLQMWRRGDDKYIQGSDGSQELYHLARDPHELENRLDQEPELAQALAAEMATWLASLSAQTGPADPETIEDSILADLRSWGYKV